MPSEPWRAWNFIGLDRPLTRALRPEGMAWYKVGYVGQEAT